MYPFRAIADQMPATATGAPPVVASTKETGIPARVSTEGLYYFGISLPRSLRTAMGAFALCITESSLATRAGR